MLAQTSRQSGPEASVEVSVAQQGLLPIYIDMTDQSQNHSTLGRRRRHKSPARIPSMHDPWITWVQKMDHPRLRKKTRKRGVREESPLYLDLPLETYCMNRVW